MINLVAMSGLCTIANARLRHFLRFFYTQKRALTASQGHLERAGFNIFYKSVIAKGRHAAVDKLGVDLRSGRMGKAGYVLCALLMMGDLDFSYATYFACPGENAPTFKHKTTWQRKASMSLLASIPSSEKRLKAIIENIDVSTTKVEHPDTLHSGHVTFVEIVLTSKPKLADVWTGICKQVKEAAGGGLGVFFFGGTMRVSWDSHGAHQLTFYVCEGECILCDSLNAVCKDPASHLNSHSEIKGIRVHSYTLGYSDKDLL